MRSEKHKNRKIVNIVLAVVLVVAAATVAAELVSLYFYGNIRSVIEIEAGDPVPAAADFIKVPKDSIEILSSTESVSSTQPGTYPLRFRWKIFNKTAKLIIKDTVAPVVEAKDYIGAINSKLVPADFIASANDATEIRLRFRNEPDTSKEGKQTVEVVAQDAGGNETVVSPSMELFDDFEPPVITGAINRTAYVKETIAYRTGITVTDNLDPAPKLTIDNSEVDLNQEGVYPVTFTATDFCGNISTVTVNVTVEPVPSGYENIEKLNEKADQLLAKLIKPEMTEIEKAFEIFRWIRTNVPWYSGRVEHNYVDQALKALNGNSGDCYTCTVGAKVLLERAGFEVKYMERTGVPGRHYWLMIKVGGEWYHLDPSPIYVNQFICFLGTDEQLKAFGNLRPNYYEHDWSLFPKTPEESPAKVVLKNGKYTLVVE
ncbi:MAG: hypothetical protein IJM39_04210 [Firmicutes bacterium]|nr:hypothetical protein [Bacillota bacterium]